MPAASTVQEEGGAQSHIRVLLTGWAVRYRTLLDGRRQIVSILLPGDVCGLFGAVDPCTQCGIETLSDVTVAETANDAILDLFRSAPKLAAALCWIAGRDECVLVEQIVRIGRLDGARRIAHLLLELRNRGLEAGLDVEEVKRIPLTQERLAETLGMSHVHANRSCRQLQRHGWICSEQGELILRDLDGLAQFAGDAPGAHAS